VFAGCNNGASCPFCHLCEPGERVRRKKEKLALRREAREAEDAKRRLDKDQRNLVY
jgi:hypothetical protein